jgi:Ca2+-transporting ATPase
MLITQMRVMQDLFGTLPLTGQQWLLCLVPGVVLLLLGELFKVILRARHSKGRAAVTEPVPA